MDGIKPETQPQIETSDSSPQQQQLDISPLAGGYPEPLQTASPSGTRSRSRTGSRSQPPPPRRPQEAEQPAVASPGPGHERMPSVHSTPPRDGQFGVVSSSGQLVCEFRPPPPQPPPKVPEGSYNITSASFATSSRSNPGGQSAPRTASTPEPAADHDSHPSAVDRDSYPEVYMPIPTPGADGAQQTGAAGPGKLRHSSSSPSTTPPPPPPRKPVPAPMDNHHSDPYDGDLYPSSSPTPAPAYSSPADYQRIGYTGTLDMSTAVATVTPLAMLGDQPDTVDCPFCMRRVETRVRKRASSRTHTWATILFFTTILGVVAPYCCDWYVNVEHHCKNCGRTVAQRRFDSDEVEALGTRPECRQVSAYQPAEEPAEKNKRRSGL